MYESLESYSFHIIIYNTDKTVTLYDRKIEGADPNTSKPFEVRPTQSSVLFEREPVVVIIDNTTYGFHRKKPLQLNIKYKEGNPPLHVTFSPSNRFENKRIEIRDIPMMPQLMTISFA